MIFTIVKENSTYGNMKYHLIGKSDLCKTSFWYKTLKDAEYNKTRLESLSYDTKYKRDV